MNHFEFFKSHGVKVSSSDGQGLQIQGLSFLQGNKRDFILQYARRHKPGILIELLWAKARTLAEYIDNPEGDPLADRQARLPELQIMMDRIAEIGQAGTLTPDPEPPTPTGIVTTTTTTTTAAAAAADDDTSPDTCPAQCKTTGKCYARAYFEHKPCRAVQCDPDKCTWMART